MAGGYPVACCGEVSFPFMPRSHPLNIGPKSNAWLASVGITTEEQLEELGAVAAYQRVKAAYPHIVSLNLLYALQANLLDLNWIDLPPDIKAQLKSQVDLD